MQPGRKLGIAAEVVQPAEGADERILREIARQVVAAREPERQPIDPVHVRLVQRSLSGRVAHARTGDQRIFQTISGSW